jgi:hypothetical protein
MSVLTRFIAIRCSPKVFGVVPPNVPGMIPRVQDDTAICGRDAMKPPRLSIAKVMAVVAIFAINMAALRYLHSYDEDLDQGIALAGFALQFGVFQSIRNCGRVRTFWLGFVALDSAAMISFAWCVTYHNSTMFLLWSEYTRYANKYANSTTHIWDFYNRTQIEPVCVIAQAVIWSVPQLIIAFFGGLTARSIITPTRLPVTPRLDGFEGWRGALGSLARPRTGPIVTQSNRGREDRRRRLRSPSSFHNYGPSIRTVNGSPSITVPLLSEARQTEFLDGRPTARSAPRQNRWG